MAGLCTSVMSELYVVYEIESQEIKENILSEQISVVPICTTLVKCYLKIPCSLDKLKPSSAVQESFQVNSRRSKDPLQNEDKKILFLDPTTRFCAGAIRTANQT